MAATKKTKEELLEQQRAIARELLELEGGEAGAVSAATNAEEGNLEGRRGPEDFYVASNTEMVTFIPNHMLQARPKHSESNPGRMQQFFFYKRLTDEKILCFTEGEADFMMKSSHRVILRQLGVSDGSAYSKYIKECGMRSGQRIPRKKAQEILDGAFNAELEAAKGHYREPDPQNIHFDDTVKRHKNARSIIQGFNPS